MLTKKTLGENQDSIGLQKVLSWLTKCWDRKERIFPLAESRYLAYENILPSQDEGNFSHNINFTMNTF